MTKYFIFWQQIKILDNYNHFVIHYKVKLQSVGGLHSPLIVSWTDRAFTGSWSPTYLYRFCSNLEVEVLLPVNAG